MNRLVEFTAVFFPSVPSEGRIGSIEFNIWLAQITGVPLLGLKNEPKGLQVLLILYGFILTTVTTCFYTGFEMYDLILCWNDLNALTQNTCLSLTHLAGLTKTINTLMRYNDVRRVIERLKLATQKYVVSEKQIKVFMRGELENKIALLIYSSLVGFTGLLGIGMLLYNPQAVAGQIFPYRVVLPSWMPFSLQLTYMGLSVFIFALQIVAIDYMNINLINQIRAQLKILNISFDDLMMSKPAVEYTDTCKVVEVAAISKSPNERLHAIVEHHILLMRLREDVERVFRFPILIQFFTSLVIFAMTGFQATVRTDRSNGAVLIYFYCGCIFCELFFYCWFGNVVFEQSLTLSTSGYNSSWYQFDIRFRRSLLIFLSNAQRPFLFTAGGFLSLSLPSFTGILRKSYTYITVLQRLYSR